MPTSVKPDASKLVAGVSLNDSQKANVFISSRMSYSLGGEELRSIRAQLKALLQQAWPFMNVELAEDWTAGRKGSPRELSIRGARWSDLMIAIFVADPGFCDEAGLFATEAELETALEDSWDKIIFFAHKDLVSSLQTQPDQYRELIKRVMAYKDGKNVSIFENTNDLYQDVFNAVAGHVAATMRRYPARTSGKSTEQVRWELMTFTERHAAIQEAFKGVAADVKNVGAVRALNDAEPRQGHVLYRMTVQAEKAKRIVVPVIVSACPDRFSFADAARFVGYHRAVDKAGDTVDFLLTAKRDRKAALRFLRKAIGHHGVPEKITIDKSGANTAAIESYNAEHEADIAIRQIKYLNNIVEQDHRAVKRVARPMLGFKSFRSAAVTLVGIELMHMVRKGQLRSTGKLCPAQQFYALAA